MFIISAEPIPAVDAAPVPACATVLQAPRQWSYRLDEPNVLVLDQAECTIDGKALDEEVHFITSLDDILREKFLGVRHRGGAMVQPWMTPANPVPDKVLDVELRFNFLCETLPTGLVELAIERPDLYEIKLNRTDIPIVDNGEWIDPAIRRIVLPAEAFVPGLNYLTLRGKYHQYLPGLEAVYLLGGFGVRDQRVLTELPAEISIGDWCAQGLPFYSGCVTYSADVTLPENATAMRLELGKWQGSAVGISLNGGARRLLGWPPYKTLFIDDVHGGVNHLEITVYSSRRNSFGPFYHFEPSPEWVGSGQLKAFHVAHKQLVPCGLLSPVGIFAQVN